MLRKAAIIAPALAGAILGCSTPAVYVAEPLPRYIIDPVTLPEEYVHRPEAEAPAAENKPISLADAVQECVLNNLHLKAGEEKICTAQAEYVTDSLIPNSEFILQGTLLPITALTFDKQGGPPQYDAFVTMPIDWCVFGKRVAAQAAGRLGVDVAQAEFAETMRKEISQTVDAFYDVLRTEAALKLAEEDAKELQIIEQTAKDRAKAGFATPTDENRARLAVLDAQNDIRRRRAAAETAKAKLKMRLGRPPQSPDVIVKGTLAVREVAPHLSLNRAWELAELNRPDILAARRAIFAADATLERERRRALPQLSVIAGVDYQDQIRIVGFRNPWMWTTGIQTYLPTSDRGQGKIMSAESAVRSARANLGKTYSEARAELEQALAEYAESLNGITGENVQSLQTAREVRDGLRTAYRKGEKDINLLDAIDAEKAYRDRLRNMLNTYADYWQALNHVNAAVGFRVLSAQESETEKIVEDAKQHLPQNGNHQP